MDILGYGIIPQTSVEKPMPEKTIDWSKPLEVKVWGEIGEENNTDGWVDIVSLKDGGSDDFWVRYKKNSGNVGGLYFTKQGEAHCYHKLIGKVRNKKESTKYSVGWGGFDFGIAEFGQPLTILHLANYEDVLKHYGATPKDANGKDVKVPKGDIKNPGTITDCIGDRFQKGDKVTIRKNNIVIEKFPDKVVIKEINLMTSDEVGKLYSNHICYEYNSHYPHMYYYPKEVEFSSKTDKLVIWTLQKNITIVVGNEYTLTEWNEIWSDIKKCGERLSTIIKANKRPEQGKKEVLYV